MNSVIVVFLENAWLFFVLPFIIGALRVLLLPRIWKAARDYEFAVGVKPMTAFVVMTWGSFILLMIVFFGFIFSATADCLRFKDDKADWSQCEPIVRSWYFVFEEWQTAVGAVFGLFSVAWSSFYQTTYGKPAS